MAGCSIDALYSRALRDMVELGALLGVRVYVVTVPPSRWQRLKGWFKR